MGQSISNDLSQIQISAKEKSRKTSSKKREMLKIVKTFDITNSNSSNCSFLSFCGQFSERVD